MNVIVILVLLSLVLVVVALWAFFWAINSKQFDDLDSPAYSIFKEDKESAYSEKPKDKPKDDSQDKNNQEKDD